MFGKYRFNCCSLFFNFKCPEIKEQAYVILNRLGKRLIERAVEIAAENRLPRLAVIAAVGTRGYYRKRGFRDGNFYMIRDVFSDNDRGGNSAIQ